MKYKVKIDLWSKNNIGKNPDIKQTYVTKAKDMTECKKNTAVHVANMLASLEKEGLKLYPKIKIQKM